MKKKEVLLTTSVLDRQNILNNDVAISEIKKEIAVDGVFFADSIYFTKEMVANFFDVEIRTIERYISLYNEELKSNYPSKDLRP